ncbi:arginyl-tRNA synthetase [Pseudopedobacter saltans DSM 12145]|uniref:Arginine--tRNA ligase n=1 Tax=Pseudopedobacter saltans (strain ATCC 51119 / DSM 12145 / JCM 21818 / CCUG 39354 / LMG 10337 / NBRC 100064 / NCIMB 13643) TaxID=762903 RepID=F0S942_PSESL|nr:arginine--tRNA ligase [Pseudopedobacter saltans]ADY51340.1 arginyl-tRNA synthetase [Pseudopedobacter saltans DSM 12145]
MIFLAQAISQAFKASFEIDIEPSQITLEQTKKEFEGHQTLVVFPFVRQTKKSPEQTAQILGEYLKENYKEIESFNVIKGFLNIVYSDAFWLNVFQTEISADDFAQMPFNGEKVMVEYSSPNTNKPLHLGHIRNNLLGFSVAELLKASGYQVIKANLVNDRGIHICKSMLAWQKFGNGETPESSGLKGDHLVGKYYVIFDKEYKKEIEGLKAQGKTEEEAKKEAPLIKEAQAMLLKWEQGDQEVIQLWKTMNSWVYAGFEETYKELGVNFDKFYYESDTYLLGKDIVEEGLAKGVFFKKEDNSVWIDLTEDGLDEKLVRRGDGTSVYITQDLGTAQLKYDEFGVDRSIYVVGNEQDYHFKVLFLILKKLGKTWADGLYHLSYGMVDLPSGKMKSREGTVVDADDLIEEMRVTAKEKTEALGKVDHFDDEEKEKLYHMIGMGALKYFLLKVEPKKRLLFDPKESIDFQGNTGPFIQYSHARIKSVLNKAGYDNQNISTVNPEKLQETELELIQVLSRYPSVLNAAARDFNPGAIANYTYDLAKAYNKFYQSETILKVEDADLKTFRLKLSYHTADTIRKAMALLGIEVPERM